VFYISQTSTPIKKFNGNINEASKQEEKLVLLVVVVIYQMLTQYFIGVTFWQRGTLVHVINT
jgi:hypothetical protein